MADSPTGKSFLTEKPSGSPAIPSMPAFFVNETAVRLDRERRIARYRSVFDEVYKKNRSHFDALASKGDGHSGYYMQYVLDGTLCMYEATSDEDYLKQALSWAEAMVSKAEVIDALGTRNWRGKEVSSHAESPHSSMLEDLQGSTELARAARIVLKEPGLKKKYGKRAEALKRFVKEDILRKHLDGRKSLKWFISDADEYGEALNDKTALLLSILSDIHLIDGEGEELLEKLAKSFHRRLQPYRGGLIWDKGLGWEGHSSADTSHANRFPSAAIDLHRAGVVFTQDDLKGLSALLVNVIWNGSSQDPRFTNFIDGTNGPFRKRGPWANGRIDSGWVALGEFDPKVQALGEAVLDSILMKKRNPSLDYMNTPYGILGLSGHLAKNARSMKAAPSLNP